MKKYVIRKEDRTTAIKPAMMPPNQALPIMAAKNRKTNGYAMTCCNGNVQSSATATKQTEIASGFMPFSNIACVIRLDAGTVMTMSSQFRMGGAAIPDTQVGSSAAQAVAF